MEGKTIEIVLYIVTVLFAICSGIYITIGKERYRDEKPVFCKEGLDILKSNIFLASIYIIISLIMLVGIVFLDRKDGYVLTYQEIVTIFQKFTLVPLLLITFIVDIKDQSGIFFTMLHCIDLANPITNLIYLKESIIGLFTAIGIFGLMAILRRNNCR